MVDGPQEEAPDPVDPPGRDNRIGVILGAGVLVIVLVLGMTWLWWSNRPDQAAVTRPGSSGADPSVSATGTPTSMAPPTGLSSSSTTPGSATATRTGGSASASSGAVPVPSARSTSTTTTSSGEKIAASQLRVGDCLLDPGSAAQVDGLTRVPCSQPHYAEVYSEFELAGSGYPGDPVVQQRSDDGCNTRFTSFVGRSVDDSALTFLYFSPTSDSWAAQNDRIVTCAVYDKSGKDVTNTLKAANR